MISDSATSLRVPYGPDPAQHLTRALPSDVAAARGVVVLMHGGYWRSALDSSLMHPLAGSLLANGWVVANIEYRRGSAGPWPTPLEDCRAALDVIRAHRRALRVRGPIISIGHSVGGQLALLSAQQVDAVVALAPVTDVVRTYHDRAGDDAAHEYFGASPAEAPELYRDASAIRQLPLGRPVLIIHGVDDARVDIDQSREFARASRSLGEHVRLREHQRLSHLDAIDPSAVHWDEVLAWIAAKAGRTPR